MSIVGCETPPRLSRVLAAVDDDDVDLKVVRAAARLSVQLAADLGVVHAVQLPHFPPEAYTASISFANRAQAEAERHVRDMLGAVGVTSAWQLVVVGWPVDVILSAAREWSADLLVAGHAHRSHFGRLRGSVSCAVLCRARCPVVLVSR